MLCRLLSKSIVKLELWLPVTKSAIKTPNFLYVMIPIYAYNMNCLNYPQSRKNCLSPKYLTVLI